jgi:acyl dehydratase
MSDQAKWTKESVFTEEIIKKQRDRVGRKMRPDNVRSPYVDIYGIIAFAHAIGDDNPLWTDPEYGPKTRYGRQVAPTPFLCVMSTGEIMQGMPGIQAYHSSTRWESYKPLYAGDKIHLDCTFIDFQEKKSDFAPRWFIEVYETLYYNQLDELVAKNISGMVRVDRAGTKKKGKFTKLVVPHPWANEERRKIELESLETDIRRGQEPRFWEDVTVGQELPTMVKGPIRMCDLIAWVSATSMFFTNSTQCTQRLLERHPGLGMLHPDSNAVELIPIVHWDKKAAVTTGLPGAYDLGAQRSAWWHHSLTNWAGDDGWVKVNDCQYRGFVYMGDALWFKAKVVNKYVDQDGDHCVDIESHTINQRSQDVMPGMSTIALPSREKGTWPMEKVARKR